MYSGEWTSSFTLRRETNPREGDLKDLFWQMIQVKLTLRRLLKKTPVLCKFQSSQHPPVGFCYICGSHLHLASPFSPFQGSIEAEENSPSGSTPASPQTKTASEGELSTTAAELLQDYMTTVRCYQLPLCRLSVLISTSLPFF